MRVFVIMKNDYPQGVVSSEGVAQKLVDLEDDRQRRLIAQRRNEPWEYWRYYEFEVDAQAPASPKPTSVLGAYIDDQYVADKYAPDETN
jgi:hypothetical protein